MSEKIALVTGASRGLGFALAEALAPEYHIVAVGRTVGGLEDLDDRIKAKGGAATLAPMDITKPEAMAQLCRSVWDRWGGIALWLHTAVHAAPLAPANHLDQKDWAKSIATNLTATGVLIPYITPLLGAEGRAVFFEDDHSGQKFYGHYGTTKGAQIALARSWQAETGKTGPKVEIVSPKPMHTTTRVVFHPGEDKTVLASPYAEASRLLADLDLI